jgi:hypothetical protein
MKRESGIDRSEARPFMRQALRQWLDLALVDAADRELPAGPGSP